ncbi:DEAD/DEAH box helicase, partial [bacterium]|nr:DEAD/DEAH box helicase [bacterium]
DYTGSATRNFADPEFDGFPALITQEEINSAGESVQITTEETQDTLQVSESIQEYLVIPTISDDSEGERRKYYVDGAMIEIGTHIVYELDTEGKQLRVVKFADYAAQKIRTLFPSAAEMKKKWTDPDGRTEIISNLEERGINFEELALASNQPEADPFDLLCHIAFNAPLRTRRERADRLRRDKKDFFDQYGPMAKTILNQLLDKYAEHGTAQFIIPDVLKVPPISEHGNVMEITQLFGGAEKLREAVQELQNLLYVA